MAYRIFNHEGNERDAAWLEARYGPVNVRTSTAEGAFRLLELRESIGPAVYVVTVLDEHGQPIDRQQVARHWPDPELPVLPENEWHERGVWGPTNAEGNIGFGSGGGDVYFPESGGVGASSFFVLGAPSDCVGNIGTLADHHAHLDMTFRWVEGWTLPPEPPEPPLPPPPSEIEHVKELIRQARGLLREALELLGA